MIDERECEDFETEPRQRPCRRRTAIPTFLIRFWRAFTRSSLSMKSGRKNRATIITRAIPNISRVL